MLENVDALSQAHVDPCPGERPPRDREGAGGLVRPEHAVQSAQAAVQIPNQVVDGPRIPAQREDDRATRAASGNGADAAARVGEREVRDGLARARLGGLADDAEQKVVLGLVRGEKWRGKAGEGPRLVQERQFQNPSP